MRIRFGFLAVAVSMLLFSIFHKNTYSASPPQLPDTLKIPVTFYDFHSDSSNPEFEINPNFGDEVAGRRVDMVRETLDSDGKPVLGAEPYFNRRIDRWFRKWEPGDFEIYNYKDINPARYTRYNAYNAGRITLGYDTSFKNIVISDTLPFILIDAANGTYQFQDNSFFPLDGRGFGNEGRSHNYSFAMELHYYFTKVPGLSFAFTGDDDVWAFVDSTLRMDIGGIHDSISDAFDLDREPDLVDRATYSLDFFYVERHVTGSSIKITTNILSPPVNFEIDVYPNDTICALTEITLRADVSDDFFGERLDLSQNTIWKVLDYNGQDSSCLKQNVGQSVAFEANVAYSKVTIEASVPNDDDTLKDTVTLYIEPCDPYMVSIEASIVDTSTADTNTLRHPQPIGEITILSNMTSNDGYAVARDSSGAFVSMCDPATTTWNITPDGTSFASAAGEDGRKYHGVVTRLGQEGNTFVVASQPDLVSDTAPVVIASYYIVKYQLRDSATGEIVHSITMNTDQSNAYQSWGLKSTAVNDTTNPNSWIIHSADWTLVTDSIEVRIPPPDKANHWLLDPTKPGSGTIQLINPDDARTEQLDIPVIITVADPSGVDITLITPQTERRAGDTLLFLVEITNGDGLVPGAYCFGNGGDDPTRVSYSDNLNLGGAKPSPTIQIDGKDSLLNILNQQVYKYDQCFNGGVDTVKVVLFYAPFNTDSMHQVTVNLNPQLNAVSEKFILLPNELDSIAIEDVNYNPLGSQTLTGTESVTPYSDGYDRIGNRIGFINTDWSSDGSLDPIDERGKQTYIGAANVTSDQQGNVCATEKRESDGKEIEACILVTIIGPKKRVTTALTQDSNGNGYLDGILIIFDRKVDPQEININNFINISTGSIRFTPTEITQLDSSTYLLKFGEQVTTQLQTSWRPYFDISGSSAVGDTVQIATADGAGPVIATVTKDVSNNLVKVVLSEKVLNVSGNDMQVTDSPALTFDIYSKNDDGTFTELSLLDSITNFTPPITADSIFYFYQYKEYDLSTYHYLNLEAQPSVVQDFLFNKPNVDNRKVQIKPTGQKQEILIAPNPTSSSFLHTSPGSLQLNSSKNHVNWARDKQGALIRVMLTPDSMMSATIKIYDMVGNLVAWAHQDDFLAYLKATNSLVDQEDVSVYQLDHYWNGSNQQGMKVAPGLYRVVYYVDYQNPAMSDVKLVKILGISK